jgi:hypothetical protein
VEEGLNEKKDLVVWRIFRPFSYPVLGNEVERHSTSQAANTIAYHQRRPGDSREHQRAPLGEH